MYFFFVKCIYVFILMLLTSNSLQHDLYVYIYLSYSTVFNFIWIFKIKLFLTLNKFIFYRFSQCFQHIQYLFLMFFFWSHSLHTFHLTFFMKFSKINVSWLITIKIIIMITTLASVPMHDNIRVRLNQLPTFPWSDSKNLGSHWDTDDYFRRPDNVIIIQHHYYMKNSRMVFLTLCFKTI